MPRTLRALAFSIVAVAAGLALAGARETPPPRELGQPTPLGASTLHLELDGADIDIRVSRDDPPALRATDGVRLELEGSVQRVLPVQPGQKRRARISMVVAPWQSITVIGAGLGLEALDEVLPEDEIVDQAEAPRPEATALAGRPAAAFPAGDDDEDVPDGDDALADGAPAEWDGEYGVWQLRLDDSQVLLQGLRNLDLELRTSETVVQSSGGPQVATVNAGRYESTDHDGKLDLLITDAVGEVQGLRGPLKLDQLGGSVLLRDGQGRTVAKVEDGALRVDTRRGRFDLSGTAGVVDLRGLESNTTTVAGDGHDVRLSASDVPFHSRQKGGRLEVIGGSRTLFLQATDLDVEVSEHIGLVKGSLTGGRLALNSPEARLQLDAAQATVALDGLRQLQLGGRALTVEGVRVLSVQRFELVDSEVDLDLSDLRHDAHFAIAGEGTARFTMASPCLVKVGGRTDLEQRVDVSGCDLRSLEQSAVGAHSRERYGEGLRRLTLMLAGEPDVEVVGR
ncbi:MAG: hypothetical protein AAGF23_15500 [Acidobacteriota bacterium]